MTTLREAAQQALDDLKDLHTNHNITYAGTISRLEAALAQEQAEPVAWRYELATTMHENEYGGWEQLITPYRPNVPEGSIRNLTPLYTAPPQRKPLTAVAIYRLFVRSGLGAYHQKDFVVQTEYDRCVEAFARAIERAHGIGGQDE